MKSFIFAFTLLIILVILFNSFTQIIPNKYANYFTKSDQNISSNTKPKILCLIVTADDNIKKRSIPVYKTWAKKCDMALFACNCSNFTNIMKSKDPRNFFDNDEEYKYALNLSILPINMTEHYSKMAEKIMKVLRYAYDQYIDKFDWFLLTDDDTFIFVDHLYQFISNKSPKDLLTYGYNFKAVIPTGYQSGGGGILITHESLKRMGANIYKGSVPGCNAKNGYGDVALGRCAYHSNISLGNSLDEQGRERFHFNSFNSHYKGLQPDWAYEYSQNGIKDNFDCCSNHTISFHYTSVKEMERFTNLMKNESLFSLLSR